MSSLRCKCNQGPCVCGVGSALIGPADLATDGTIQLYWEHSKPSMRFAEIVTEFGTPNVLDTSPNGFAQWRSNMLVGTPYTEIVLKDEEVPHCCPMKHDDYLCASVCVDLSPEVQMALYPVTKSVWYDRLKHILTARCHFMGPNLATLLLATRMQLGQVRLDQAPGLYGGMINMANDPGHYAAMTAELTQNLAMIGCSKPTSDCSRVQCPKSIDTVSSY